MDLGDANGLDSNVIAVEGVDLAVLSPSRAPHAVDEFEKEMPHDPEVEIVGENWSSLYEVPLARHVPR